MKSCDEMVSDLLGRRDAYAAEQKQKKKRVTRIVCAACPTVLAAAVVLAGIGTRRGGSDLPAVSVPENMTAGEDVVSVVTQPTGGTDNATDTDDEGFVDWNGKELTYSLYEVLKNTPKDEKLAVRAKFYENFWDVTAYSYEGKRLAVHAAAANEEAELPEKLLMLLKCGDSLKYGEALYTGGTPVGERWTKEYYDEQVAFFGEELLSAYIVDGEFLREKVTADLEACRGRDEAQTAYRNACAAYTREVLTEVCERLAGQGIRCEVGDGSAVMYVTGDELAAIPLDDGREWVFSSADRVVAVDDE